jgi:hypothetical protein
MTFSDTMKKHWFISILAIIFIAFCFVIFNWNGIMTLIGRGEPHSTLFLYELNESIVPQGNIISLSEPDFGAFPKLAPVIRDRDQKPDAISDNGRRLYIIPLKSEEYYKFNKLYLAPGFFEYKGKYYFFNPPALH